jgi:cyclophilin family peptidyl-prolyl cis-trans isomerase
MDKGGLFSCGRQENKELPLEPKLNNSKGAVSLITGTSEFFFSLEDHPEWNGSFSVWGKVVGARSWRVLERLVALPTRQEIHPSGTTLRILLKPVVFKARIGTNIQPTLVMDKTF